MEALAEPVGWPQPDPELVSLLAERRDGRIAGYARNREDLLEHANIELRLREGGYNDRQIFELIQNAADAAREASVPARIELILTENALYAANVGAGLSREGVLCLLGSHLSPKGGDQIGRFGLGFKSVLAISSQPEILSRTLCLRFDESASRDLLVKSLSLTPDTRTPVMRLAWSICVAKEMQSDGDLRSLGAWATTIIRLRFPAAETAPRVAQALDELPPEFMLFLDSAAKLTLEDRRAGWRRSSAARQDGDTTILVVDGEEQRWKLFCRRVAAQGKDAIADAGAIHSRDSYPLAWAVPLDARRGREAVSGQFWALFPLAERARLPGIFNAPWKTNDDRTGMLAGRFNEFLLGRMAELVVDSLSSLAGPADPAAVLDFMPRREGGSAMAEYLADQIWRLLAPRACVPDVDGAHKRATELCMHPDSVPADLVARWCELAPAEVRARFLHPTATGRDRLARFRQLVKATGAEQEPRETPISTWLEMVATATPATCLSVLRLAIEVHERTERVPDQKAISTARIILLSTGELTGTPAGALYFSKGLAGASSCRVVAPELEADSNIRESLHSIFGVKALNSEAWVSELVDLLRAPVVGWPAIWSQLHAAPVEVAGRALEAADAMSIEIKVQSARGSWHPLDELFLLGQIISDDNSKEHGDHVIDPVFHHRDMPTFRKIGVSDVPVRRKVRIGSMLDAFLAPMREAALKLYNETLTGGQRPSLNHLQILAPKPLSQPLDLFLSGASPAVVSKLTSWLLRNAHGELSETERFGHASYNRRSVYPVIGIPGRLSWLLSRMGRISIGLMHVPLRQSLPFLVRPWSELITQDAEIRRGLMHVRESLGDSWLPAGPQAKWGLWRALEAQLVDCPSLPDERCQDLYEDMGLAGFAPHEIRFGGELVPTNSIHVTSDATLTASARRSGLRVLTISAVAQKPFVNAGARPLTGEARARFEQVEPSVPFSEALWHLGAILGPRALRDLPDVILCQNLRVEFGSEGTGEPVLFKRTSWISGDHLYIDQEAATAQPGREQLIREIILALVANAYLSPASAGDIERLTAHEEVLRKRRAVAAGADLQGRLLLAVEGHVSRFTRHFVPELRELIDASGHAGAEVADLFLATFGVDALRQLRDDLRELGFEPPERWGSPQTAEFVESLGFPLDFAVSTSGSRQPVELVSGPRHLPDLHPYQLEIHDELTRFMRSPEPGRRVMVSLPTGAGKTRVAVEAVVAEILRTRHGRPLVLWVAQRDELCEQAVRCFQHVWQNKGEQATDLRISRLWGAAGGSVAEGDSTSPHVVVATIQTLTNRFHSEAIEWLSSAGAVVIDEAHHAVTTSYTQLLRWLKEDTATGRQPPVLGLSATPFRGNSEEESERLAKRFEGRLLPAPAEQSRLHRRLRDEGVLASITHEMLDIDQGIPFAFTAQEILEIQTFSEIPQSALARLARDPGRNDRIVARLLATPPQSSVLLFANSVEHAQFIAGRLNLAGRRAAAIVGDTRQGLRQRFIDDFQCGRISILTTHTVLATGFDAPKVDTILISRPTLSSVLFQQMIGRGLRGPRNGGKPTCRLVTVRDNLARFGDQLAFNHFVDFWQPPAPRGT